MKRMGLESHSTSLLSDLTGCHLNLFDISPCHSRRPPVEDFARMRSN